MATTTRYRDFDLNFKPHPVTGDLVMKTDTQAIIQALRNLIFLNFYEKPFQPDIGCGIYSLLFETISNVTSLQIKTAVMQTITNYEPRAKNVQVSVVPDELNHKYDVGIRFEPANTDTPVSFNVVLERVR